MHVFKIGFDGYRRPGTEKERRYDTIPKCGSRWEIRKLLKSSYTAITCPLSVCCIIETRGPGKFGKSLIAFSSKLCAFVTTERETGFSVGWCEVVEKR